MPRLPCHTFLLRLRVTYQLDGKVHDQCVDSARFPREVMMVRLAGKSLKFKLQSPRFCSSGAGTVPPKRSYCTHTHERIKICICPKIMIHHWWKGNIMWSIISLTSVYEGMWCTVISEETEMFVRQTYLWREVVQLQHIQCSGVYVRAPQWIMRNLRHDKKL